jgi:DNA-binding transcriptional LysR family regulator
MELLFRYPYNRKMTLEGIDVFVKVVQCGSFTQAARLLQMPLTTVSGKVAALEKRLGATLIRRTTRKLHITSAGSDFFHHCVRALEELGAAERELASAKAEPDGLLRITAPVDVGHSILPAIVSAFVRRHPRVKAELLLTNRIVDLVGEGVDLGLRVGPLKDSGLVVKRFLQPQAGLWASPAYLQGHGMPRSLKDLAGHQFVDFTKRQGRLQLTRAAEQKELRIHPRIVVDDMEALKAFVLSGDALGAVPDFLCQREEAAGQLVRVLPQWSWNSFPLNFVYPGQRFIEPKLQAFLAAADELRPSLMRAKS